MDFRKAFNYLNHDHLLQKLRTFGIKGKKSEWFSSYLKGTYKITTHDKTQAEPIDNQDKVPQGSVLGQGLFLLLPKNMPEEKVSWLQETCYTVIFADDTLSIKTIDTLQQK